MQPKLEYIRPGLDYNSSSSSSLIRSEAAQRSILYVTTTEDPNSAFAGQTQKDLETRIATLSENNFSVDSQCFGSIKEIWSHLKGNPRKLSILCLRGHGCRLTDGGHKLILNTSKGEDGCISTLANDKQAKTVRKICQSVEPGGVIVVESCHSGAGKNSLVKFLANNAQAGVVVIGSKNASFNINIFPEEPNHITFTDINTDADVTRIYYKQQSELVQKVSTAQLDFLYGLLCKKLPDEPREKLLHLCYQLLGESNDAEKFAAIKRDNHALLEELFPSSESFLRGHENNPLPQGPLGKADVGSAWQTMLSDLEAVRARSISQRPVSQENEVITLSYTGPSGNKEVDQGEDDPKEDNQGNILFVKSHRPYVSAYKFLLGCGLVEQYKSLFMLLDNNKKGLKNAASLPIFRLSGLPIHSDESQPLSQTLSVYFQLIKESYQIAKALKISERWFQIIAEGACFNGRVEGILLFTSEELKKHHSIKNIEPSSEESKKCKALELIWQKLSENPLLKNNTLTGYEEISSWLENPENARLIAGIKHLDLAGLSLEILPDEIGRFIHLETLLLTDNKLNTLPESFENLTNLNDLDLSRNLLSSLPDSFGRLTKLKTLRLMSNELKALPDSFENLTSLCELDLWANKLPCLPECIGNLQSLELLDLSHNVLSCLPASIGNLQNLKFLDLSENQLSCLPDSIGNLPNLKSIDLEDNDLTDETINNIKRQLGLQVFD